MMSNIKSNFIKKKLFSLLADKPKLNIIHYNKRIQKITNIDIDDYKKYADCILSIDTKGRGIIRSLSDNDIILFEGEYSNRKKNGKGIQYYKGRIIFEGEYKDNKK